MKVSIIIPVYNVQAYLRQCVQSVLTQTYRDMEIILVDDGSTDNSGALCDTLATEDKRIHAVHKPNGGLSDARNIGLQHATGEYVLFLDSDDYYADNYVVANLVKTLEYWQYPDDLLFCRTDFYEDIHISTNESPYHTEVINAKLTPIECFAYLLNTQRFNMSACFQIIRREVLVGNHIEFVVGLRNEDIDWSIQLWRKLRSVKAVNLYGYVYRHRANSITTTLSIHDYRSYDIMFDKWQKTLTPTIPEDRLFLQYLAYIYPTMVYGYFQLKRVERKEAYTILQKQQGILAYSITRKSDRMIHIRAILGLRLCVYIFAFYGSCLKPLIRRLKR